MVLFRKDIDNNIRGDKVNSLAMSVYMWIIKLSEKIIVDFNRWMPFNEGLWSYAIINRILKGKVELQVLIPFLTETDDGAQCISRCENKFKEKICARAFIINFDIPRNTSSDHI